MLAAQKGNTLNPQERERERGSERERKRENDYISIIEQLADRDLINANLVALAAISGTAKQ